MKNKYIIFFWVITGLSIHYSCKKMDDTYKKFVVPGGITYVGKAEGVHVFPGRNRIKLTWLRGTDSKASSAVVYWNDRQDSVVSPIKVTNAADSVTVWINNLSESTFNFDIFTKDDYGNYSVAVAALGQTYDSIYESGLLTRAVKTAKMQDEDGLITWYPSDTTNFTTELSYLDTNAVRNTLYSSKDSLTVLLPGYARGTEIQYRGFYRPTADCLDTFYTKKDSIVIE